MQSQSQPISPIPSSSASSSMMMASPSQQQQQQQQAQQHQYHSDAPFPSKLYEMLQYVEQSTCGLSDCVSWLPHGRAFKIHDNKKFMAEVAHLFFRATKLRSVHRQLNLWGFKRVATGKERDSWHHPHFLRDQPAEIGKMVRTKVKGVTKRRRTSQKEEEDDGATTTLQIQQQQIQQLQQIQLRRASAPPSCFGFDSSSLSAMMAMAHQGNNSLPITPLSGHQQQQTESSPLAFGQGFLNSCASAKLPFEMKPRRVSIASSSMALDSITSMTNTGMSHPASAPTRPRTNLMPTQLKAMPRISPAGLERRNRFQGTASATQELERRNRFQGTATATQDNAIWNNGQAQQATSTRTSAVNIDPFSIEPLDLATSNSSCPGSNSNSVSLDEFSLFIGQMIQDPN